MHGTCNDISEVRLLLPSPIFIFIRHYHALATAKYMAGQTEHEGCLVDKVKLGQLEEEIIDLWQYVYALRLQLKDD